MDDQAWPFLIGRTAAPTATGGHRSRKGTATAVAIGVAVVVIAIAVLLATRLL